MEYNYSKEDLLYMYDNLVYSREFSLRMVQAVNDGLLRTSYHTCFGEEALYVAVGSALRPTDWVVQGHRTQPLDLMRLDHYKFIAELLGRRDGPNRGAGFDFHLCDMTGPGRIGLSIGTLGSCVPQYVGFAYGLKVQHKDEIVALVHGDGGWSEGTVYEAMNIGSLYKVPMVLVIDNNGWAMTTPLERQTVHPDISDRGKAFDIPTQIVDGHNILEIRAAMDKAVEMARNNQINILEVKTKRWGPHYIGQPIQYRNDMEEIEEDMKNHDPLVIYEQYLLEHGVADEAYFEAKKQESRDDIEMNIAKASKAEFPTFEDIYSKSNIYTQPETGGDL